MEKIPDFKETKEVIRGLEKKSKALRMDVAKINQVLDAKAEENRKRKEISTEKKTELDALEEKIKTIREEIKTVEVRKDEAREEYYKKKYEYEIQKANVMHIDRMHKRKNDLIKYDQEKKLKEEEKKAERDALPNPHEDDISTCDFLLRFCRKLVKDRESKDTKVIKATETKEDLAKKAEEFKKQAEEGKIMFIKPKEEREKDEVLVIGGREKKNKNKRKKNQTKQEAPKERGDPNELNFKYEIIQNFGEVGVNPPSLFTEIEDKITELEAKRTDFFEKGEKKLDEQYTHEERDRENTENPDEDRKTRTKKENFKLVEEDEENWPTMQ